MRGKDLVERLKLKLGAKTNAELARRLGITTVAVHYWTKRAALTPRQVADAIARVVAPTGEDVVRALCRKVGAKNENQLAQKLGLTPPAIYAWSSALALSARQIANMVESARTSSTTELAASGIRPIVEFFPIERARSQGGAKWQMFDRQGRHPYRDGLRAELVAHHGVYIFFDSRGRAIYAGKARRLNLWSEMTNAFNRAREVQSIKRVRHPERRQAYRTSKEKARQIAQTQVPLSELARYFSAYEVHAELIDELEALLVRSFANDLSNVRMERFSRQRARAARGSR